METPAGGVKACMCRALKQWRPRLTALWQLDAGEMGLVTSAVSEAQTTPLLRGKQQGACSPR
jgi:hypothetical protein